MIKTLVIAIFCCLSLSAGGVFILYMNGSNIFSSELWLLSFRGIILNPGVMIEAAVNGREPAFFGGLLMASGGLVLASFLAFLIPVVRAVSILVSVMKAPKGKHGGWASSTRSTETEIAIHPMPQVSPARSARPGLKAKIVAVMRSIRNLVPERSEGFVDGDAGLDNPPRRERKIREILGRLLERARELAASRSRKKSIVISTGEKTESVIDVINDDSFLDDLRQWHGSFKSSQKSEAAIAKRAFELKARATKRVRATVVEEDAMNGEFMLRLMDAWASKVDDYDAPLPREAGNQTASREEEVNIFARAIKEVEAGEVEAVDEFEASFSPDDEDFIIDDIGHQDTGDLEADSDFDTEPAEQLQAENNDDDFLISDVSESDAEHEQGGDDIRSIGIARQIIAFRDLAIAVENFEQGWSEDFVSLDARVTHVRQLFDALKQSLSDERAVIVTLSPLDSQGDAREIEWLQEIMDTVEDEMDSLLQISGFITDDHDEDEGDGAEDLDEAFSVQVSGQDRPDYGDFLESEDEPDLEEVALHESPDQQQDKNDFLSSNVLEEDQSRTDIEESEGPKDLSIGQLEEIEMSGDLINSWGYVAMTAGAAAAKISHSIIEKDGLKRRVAGIAHLVARWHGEDSDEGRSMILIMRYVPDGQWYLKIEKSEGLEVRMVDSKGNHVRVSSKLLMQPELKASYTVIHFYGPGAQGGLLHEEDGLCVTTDVIGADKLKTMVLK